MSDVSIKSGYEKPDIPTQLWVIDTLPGSDVGHTRPASSADIVAALGEPPERVAEAAEDAFVRAIFANSGQITVREIRVIAHRAAIEAALAAWAKE